jgi:hypothetical protein
MGLNRRNNKFAAAGDRGNIIRSAALPPARADSIGLRYPAAGDILERHSGRATFWR